VNNNYETLQTCFSDLFAQEGGWRLHLVQLDENVKRLSGMHGLQKQYFSQRAKF